MKTIDLNVKITRKHIEAALPGEARKCAIAMAICESDPDIVWANVDRDFTQFGRYSDELRYKYRTPKVARDFIIAFDFDQEPHPFTLRLLGDDLVSIRPRAMHQREKAETRDRVSFAARAQGVDPKDIDPDEAPVFDHTGFAVPVREPRVKAALKAKPRAYAKRPTSAEVVVTYRSASEGRSR